MVDSRHLLSGCYLFSIQVVLLLILINIRDALNPPHCPLSTSSPAKPAQHKPPSPVWYYENVFDHQAAKLRVLSELNGAAPLRSSVPPKAREITIVTGTTKERLAAVESTAMSWGGAFSLAVHVLDEEDIPSLYEQVQQMHARVEAHGRCRLDIVVVKEDGPKESIRHLYPVNGMRNIAWRMATTKLILLLDADFKPSPRMHEMLTEDERAYQEIVRKTTQERHLFVIPAFEFLPVSKPHMDSSGSWTDVYIPRTKLELKRAWENGTVDCFHCSFSPAGHEPTNFGKYFNSATTAPYSIPYMEGFEPYLLVGRESTPMYDERFRGYGKNKISQIYSCVHGHGMRFQVIPNAFIFELPHSPSHSRASYWGGGDTGVQNLYRILGLYKRFKKEVHQMKILRTRRSFASTH